MMAEKCLHQSSGAGVNDVRKIESSVKTDDPVLPEEFGCKAYSKGIVPLWVAGCATRVLHRSEKHQNVLARSRLRKCRDVLTRDDGTADPGNVCGEMATVNPFSFPGTSLGRTDANNECPSQECTASEHWQPGVPSSPTSECAQERRKIGVEADDGPQEEVRLKVLHSKEHKGVSLRHVSERRKKLGRVVQTETEECIDQTAGARSTDYLGFLAEAEMRAAEPDEYRDMDDSDVDDFEVIPGRNAAVLTCARVHLEDNSMSSSAKRACKIPPSVSRIPTKPDIEMGTVPLPVPEDAMGVGFDAGVEPALVRRMWEGRADRTDMEVCPDTAGEYCDCDAVETLSWYATVGGIWTEQILVQEREMFKRRYKYEKSSMQTVISTTTSHRAKRDEAQLRAVTHEYADAMRVPEHYASTLRTRTLQSVISRMMSKCRTRQLESCDTLSALFHAWLERDVQMKSPKDLRLSDGWRWKLARVFFPLSLGVSTQWSPGGVHTATDVRCVENMESMESLSEVKGLMSSSRVAGRGQRSVLEMSTVAETMVHREGTRIALYLGPDRFDLLFATKELARDMQILSMLSTLKLRRFAWYLSSAADVSPFIANSDEPGTMLVWTDADWSGNELTCNQRPLVLYSWSIMGSKRGVWFSRWCRSARTRMSSARPRSRKRTAGRRWIIAGIKFTGVARIPTLVPKMWLSKRSKLLKRCQTRLAVSTTRPSVREGPRRNFLVLAKRSNR